MEEFETSIRAMVEFIKIAYDEAIHQKFTKRQALEIAFFVINASRGEPEEESM